MCDTEQCHRVVPRSGGMAYDKHLSKETAGETVELANDAFEDDDICFVVTKKSKSECSVCTDIGPSEGQR